MRGSQKTSSLILRPSAKYYNQMNQIYCAWKLILLLLVLNSAVAISKGKLSKDTPTEVSASEDQPKTIVELNRFFSQTSKQASYNITGVIKGRPLIFILKSNTNIQRLLKQKLVIGFEGGETHILCQFNKITDLCVLPVIPEGFKMSIQCQSLPCEVEWVIYQPEPKDVTARQPALNLYSLQNTTHHLIGEITCNDPKVETLDRDVTVYSETAYSRAYYNNVIYLFFESFQYGYVYIDVAEAARACAVIDFTNVDRNVRLGKSNIKDFIQRDVKTTFQLEEVPTKDFSVQCSAIRLDHFSALKSIITLNVYGLRGDQIDRISSHQIKSIARAEANDFTFIMKAPEANKYSNLTIQFEVTNSQLYLLNFNLLSESFSVQLGETAFFSLQKGDKIWLTIEGDADINDIEKYYLIEKKTDEVKMNTRECDPKVGCKIQIEALKDTENMVYVSKEDALSTQIDEQGKGLFEFEQIEFVTVGQKIKRKIRTGDSVFLRKAVQKGKSYQVHINSPNTIIYAAAKSKCAVPNAQCRERTGNFHHPFVFEAKQDDQLLINVEGLENSEFELTILSGDSLIQLSDGTSFSYTMDEQEQRIDFTFKLETKKDVTFNLVSPLNALKLFVSNAPSSEDKSLENVELSTDGFIEIKKEDIEGLQFTVSVVKATEEKYFSHFILIASTTDSKQRLEPTVTIYETLSEDNHKDFVFQFDKKDEYSVGFSVFNLKDKEVQLEMRVSRDEDWKKASVIPLNKEVEFVDIRAVSRHMCLEDGELSCEIFIRIHNQMSLEVDFTLVLFTKNAVIELKDGIWQSFPATYMMAESNFYFYPRHNNSNILVLFHSPMTRTRVASRLFKYDLESINPAEWPFPFQVDPQQKESLPFKTNHYINIDRKDLNANCWPNCVVLVNFYLEQSDIMPISMYEMSYFKVLAENSQLELPEKQKVSFTLGKAEEKLILVDLKYLMEKQAITFYSTSTIGNCSITANVYSSKQQTCPVQGEQADFAITWGEHELPLNSIKSVLKQKDMSQDSNIYLCASIYSQSSCKLTIEYSAEDDGFKEITIDTYEDIKIASNQSKYFKISAEIESFSKITRLSGFPSILMKKCEHKEQWLQCKEDFKLSEQKGQPIITKTESLREQPCPHCLTLFRFSSEQPVELSFHLQSKNSATELKEKVTMSDFLNEHESNKYEVHVLKGEDLMANIHVQEGNVEVHLTDYAGVNLMKKSSQDQRVLQFHVKAAEDKEKGKDKENEKRNPGVHAGTFSVYHFTVSSVNEEKAAAYTIGYSSGSSEFILQDGLIVDYELEPKLTHSFYYCNDRILEHVIYTLSTDSAQTLKDLKIKGYTFDGFGEEQEKTEVTLGKPNVAKKTPNPTVVFTFPNSTCFEIELQNPTGKELKVSMGINHQEVIFLPFNHEYPFQLHKGEYLNILSDVNIPGFIELQIKKCDQSSPMLGYTFDYDSFMKGEFLYKGALDELSTKIVIKANRIGTLFLNFQSAEDQASLITVKLVYSEEKGRHKTAAPGKAGQLIYQFIDSKRVNITFSAVECSSCKVAKYSSVSSQNQEDLYQQLVCPNTFFGVQKRAPIATAAIQAGKKDTELSFIYELEHEVSYLGVIAKMDSGEEIYYKPVEIATLWGKWTSQTGYSFQIFIVLSLLVVATVVLIWVRRMSRRGYVPLDDQRDY